MRKINFSQLALGLTMVLAVSCLSACKKDEDKGNSVTNKSNIPVRPAKGSSINDHLREGQFRDAKSNIAGKNNGAVIDEIPTGKDLNPFDGFVYDKNSELMVVGLSKFPDVSGTLNLAGSNALVFVNVKGTNIVQVKISKQSLLGKVLWYGENGGKYINFKSTQTDPEIMQILNSIRVAMPTSDIDLNKVDNFKDIYIAEGENVFENAKGETIKVTLVD